MLQIKRTSISRYFFITVAASFILLNNVLAQTQKAGNIKKIKRTADDYFIDEVFKGALSRYLQYDEVKPGNPEVNYKIGVCYLHSSEKVKAIKYFEKSKEMDKSKEYSDIDYYLGVAYHYNHQFDKALEYYKRYKIAVDTTTDYGKTVLPTINKYIQNCHVGKILVKNPVKAKIEHLGNNINSPTSETYPVLSPDASSLFISSQRHISSGGHIDEETDEYYEDIYISKLHNGEWGPVAHLGPVNTFKHDSPLCMTSDGKRLYIYTTDKNEATDIYYTDFNGTDWTPPITMGPNINSTSGEFGASISSDGKVFYFSSDRPGGFGGMDIYVSKLQSDNTWGPSVNIGPQINTSSDEESPDLLSDDKTLFFSSDGPNSIGGLDIFKTVFNETDSSWGKPLNIGYPVNTADHEFHVAWENNGRKGYFSSSRGDSYGDEDIYYVELDEYIEPETKIFAAVEDPKDYAMNKVFNKPMKGEVLKQKAFFDFNMYSETAQFSKEQLQEIVDMMSSYPDMLLEIGGHTDKIGGEHINKIVSEKRAKSVFGYLVKRGVDPKRLKAIGYGYSQLIVDGKSTLENGPNRRVEFKVLSSSDFFKDADHSHIFKTGKKAGK